MNKVVRNLLIAGIIISVVGIIYVFTAMKRVESSFYSDMTYYQAKETGVMYYDVLFYSPQIPWMYEAKSGVVTSFYENLLHSQEYQEKKRGYKIRLFAWNGLPLLLFGIGCAVGLIVVSSRKNKQVPPYCYGNPPQR